MLRTIGLLLICLCISPSFTAEETMAACSNRYENREDILKALPQYKNCDSVKQRFPICARTISVLYSPQPPYVLQPEDNSSGGGRGRPVGLLPDLLNIGL